jgi:surface protein
MTMIQGNNNLSVLPFFEVDAERHHNRPYAYGAVYPLYTPLGSVPPFQIIRKHGGSTVSGCRLMKYQDASYCNILSQLSEAGLKVLTFADYDIIVFPSVSPMNITPIEGQFYMELTTTDGTVYVSDVFTVCGAMDGFLNVQWWDIEDLVMDAGRIAYAYQGENVYRNTLWLQTQLGKPEYTFEEEGEARDGYFFPEKMISEKKFKCTFLAPEYLCDVMRFIRLSDIVNVYDPYGRVYKCDTFLITPKWLTQGDLAQVDCEFETNTVAKKVGMSVDAEDIGGDFNNDYNNDYTNVQGHEPAYIPSVSRVQEYVKANTTSCIFGVKGQYITEGYHHIGYLDYENKIEIWQDGTKFMFLYAGKMYAPDNCGHMFQNCAALTALDLSNFDTANVTAMEYMFYGCAALQMLDLSNFNTANVTTMYMMFFGCAALQTIYGGDWTKMVGLISPLMFTNCTSLVGGNGTTYSSAHVNAEYARIDRPGTPGYFTQR